MPVHKIVPSIKNVCPRLAANIIVPSIEKIGLAISTSVTVLNIKESLIAFLFLF